MTGDHLGGETLMVTPIPSKIITCHMQPINNIRQCTRFNVKCAFFLELFEINEQDFIFSNPVAVCEKICRQNVLPPPSNIIYASPLFVNKN